MNPIVYSNKENQFYSFLLATNNSNLGSDYINGGDVVKLFMKANLDKNILKIIWDLSSKRKAKDLNKDEFFYACRLITLAQNNQLLTEQNVIKLNNSNLIPSFNGVSFIYQEPKIQNNNFEKIENDDFKDDDFVAIDEDPNKQIKEGESIDQAKINIINAFMKSNTTIKKKEEVKEDNDKDFQFVQEEFKPTKKLDDLFGLLGNYDQDKKDEEQKVNNELNQKINNLKENELFNNKSQSCISSGEKNICKKRLVASKSLDEFKINSSTISKMLNQNSLKSKIKNRKINFLSNNQPKFSINLLKIQKSSLNNKSAFNIEEGKKNFEDSTFCYSNMNVPLSVNKSVTSSPYGGCLFFNNSILRNKNMNDLVNSSSQSNIKLSIKYI